MERFEIFGRRFGWVISTTSLFVAYLSLSVASFALYTTLNKNRDDSRNALANQRQSLIAQAFSTLQFPSAPGTSRALQLIAREGVPVNGLRLGGAYLQRADLSNLQARDAVFDRADLLGANFQEADILNSSFVGASIAGGNFRRVGQPPTPTRSVIAEYRPVPKDQRDPARAIFTNTSFRIDFSKSDLGGAAFDHAVIMNALFRGARLERTTFIGANLAKADFTGADTTNADFTDANFGSGPIAALISQEQLDAACAARRRPPVLPRGLRPPARECP